MTARYRVTTHRLVDGVHAAASRVVTLDALAEALAVEVDFMPGALVAIAADRVDEVTR